MKTLIALFLLLAAPVLGDAQQKKSQSAPFTLAQAIKKTRPAVVKIYCANENVFKLSDGTGFFINGDGLIATARHVVMLADGSTPCPKLLINMPLLPPPQNSVNGPKALNSFGFVFGSTVALDEKHDLAIVKPEQNSLLPTFGQPPPQILIVGGKSFDQRYMDRGFASLEKRTLAEGEEIFTSGYPLDYPVLITSAGYIASSGASDTETSIDIYWADIRINHGNSGGPVFSRETGNVIGIVTRARLALAETPEGSVILPPRNVSLS
jgi:S1-C subfamily serine protease